MPKVTFVTEKKEIEVPQGANLRQEARKAGLVTGSSRGMGAAIVEAFAQAGAVCLVHYFADPDGRNRRDADETATKCRAHGATVHILEADVRKYEAVERLIREAVAAAGK